jgi:hypothetical protein
MLVSGVVPLLVALALLPRLRGVHRRGGVVPEAPPGEPAPLPPATAESSTPSGS